jgi:hypothetical protein
MKINYIMGEFDVMNFVLSRTSNSTRSSRMVQIYMGRLLLVIDVCFVLLPSPSFSRLFLLLFFSSSSLFPLFLLFDQCVTVVFRKGNTLTHTNTHNIKIKANDTTYTPITIWTEEVLLI